MILAQVFIVFTSLFLNMFIKLSCIIGIFTHFSIMMCINFLHIIFRIFYYFMFDCLFFLVFALLLCVFVNVLHVFIFLINNRKLIIILQQVLLFFNIHANIDQNANCFQSNSNSSSKNLWLLFSAPFLFLKV